MRADLLAPLERASVAAALAGAGLVCWGFCADAGRAIGAGSLLALAGAWGLVLAALRGPS